MATEINLLKNALRTEDGGRGILQSRFWLWILAGLLGVELLVFGGLWFWQNRTGKEILKAEQDMRQIEFDTSKISAEVANVASFQTRLANLEIILQNHLYWSEVFQYLEQNTYKAIVFDSVQSDENTHILIISGTTLSYTDLAKFILGLKQTPKISEVELKNSTQNEEEGGGIKFVVEVKFNPILLFR